MRTIEEKTQIMSLLQSRKKIQDCEQLVGQEIVVSGWVKFCRKQGKRYFFKIYDSRKSRYSKILQIMFEKTPETQEYLSPLDHVTTGYSILVRGLIVDSPARGQKIEMIGKEYHILGVAGDTFPSAKSDLTMDYVRSIEHQDTHVTFKSAIYSVRSEMATATHKFFEEEGYTKSDMPLITFSECEGGCQPMQTTLLFSSGLLSDVPTVSKVFESDVSADFATLSERFASLESKPTLLVDFSKDFFGKKACLTVSAQLELETHLPQGDVWTWTRAVRGEPSQTSRHLCEFNMIELEHAFSTGAEAIIDISMKYIKYCLKYALDHCSEELGYLEEYYKKPIISTLSKYIADEPEIITHANVITLLKEQPIGVFSSVPDYGDDISSEHERWLTDVYFKSIVVVRKYPKLVKAFYMPVVPETIEESHGVEHVDSFDILVPGIGELVGGSQRIDDYSELMTRIAELGLDPEPLKFYTDLRKSGSIPHGGMGLGFERLIAFITCAESVKDCVPYPRYIGSGKKYS